MHCFVPVPVYVCSLGVLLGVLCPTHSLSLERRGSQSIFALVHDDDVIVSTYLQCRQTASTPREKENKLQVANIE